MVHRHPLHEHDDEEEHEGCRAGGDGWWVMGGGDLSAAHLLPCMPLPLLYQIVRLYHNLIWYREGTLGLIPHVSLVHDLPICISIRVLISRCIVY